MPMGIAAVAAGQVLVATDDDISLNIAQGVLSATGYDTIIAREGRKAFEIMSSDTAPSLAVLDCGMPGMSGTEICGRLRQEGSRNHAYVILLTAPSGQNDMASVLEAGADDYLAKPFAAWELGSRFHTANRILAERVLREREEARRKHAEESLRRSVALFRAITDNAQDLLAIVDTQHRYAYASPSHIVKIGYSPEELVGQDVFQFIDPADCATVKGAAERILESGKSEVVYFRIRHKDGTWRHVESHGGAVRATDGKPEGVLVISRMIDDRILAEAALQAANAETAAFLHAIPSILIGMDAQARITRWNLTASKVFGLSEPEVLGRTLCECGIRWQDIEMAAEIQRWLEATDTIRYDNVAYEKDGQTRYVAFNVTPVQYEQSGAGGFIIPGADITERNRLEKQRQSLEEQLRQSQKLEAVGQLAAGIAHEINTPTQYVGDNARFLKDSWTQIAGLLTQCRTALGEAKSGTIQPQTVEAFEQASRSADLDYLLAEVPSAIDQELEGLDRVTKIVRAMKEFSHPGQEKRSVNINKAIATTMTVTQNEWKYVADIVTHFDDTLPGVPCVVGEFNQVMLNLIINAAQAIALTIEQPTNHKGTITISTSRQQEYVQIAIHDTGAGIPEAIQSRIFEPFFTTKPVGAGTGQGLALAYSLIVKRHQGRIWFESKEGEGTTFFVQLPLDGDVVL